MRRIALALSLFVLVVARVDGGESCPARLDPAGSSSIHWIKGPDEDQATLDQWCRGVGPPIYLPEPVVTFDTPPDLDDLVVVTWNAHLAEGRLRDLIDALRSGDVTGEPVDRFVLLVQELYRRGPEVPAYSDGLRAAHAITASGPGEPDAAEYAATLGLSMLYVPSMRNGAELFEDRGSAILSTEPLSGAISIELPFARQRRVVVGAAVDVMLNGVRSTLRLFNVHLEPLNAPRSLWVFGNPRTRQVRALIDVLAASRLDRDVAWAGTVLGGDFNTVKAGVDEPAYRHARAWGSSTVDEDRRPTHVLGRLDYLFFRLPEGWTGSTERVEEKFGSDHHPIVGRFAS
jgi:endonuclease/exonuclease/phosphatase family metal-dependent hydrolase